MSSEYVNVPFRCGHGRSASRSAAVSRRPLASTAAGAAPGPSRRIPCGRCSCRRSQANHHPWLISRCRSMCPGASTRSCGWIVIEPFAVPRRRPWREERQALNIRAAEPTRLDVHRAGVDARELRPSPRFVLMLPVLAARHHRIPEQGIATPQHGLRLSCHARPARGPQLSVIGFRIASRSP